MKDEIKEMLNQLKMMKYDESSPEIPLDLISRKAEKTLLDYITNLQEELEEEKRIEQKSLETINNLQEENERYKKIFEGKERFSKIMPDDTDFIILSKADYDRQQKDFELWLIDYKSRCEKAIEYIKEMCYIDNDYGYCNYGDDLRPQHLVDILQGDDKDE